MKRRLNGPPELQQGFVKGSIKVGQRQGKTFATHYLEKGSISSFKSPTTQNEKDRKTRKREKDWKRDFTLKRISKLPIKYETCSVAKFTRDTTIETTLRSSQKKG